MRNFRGSGPASLRALVRLSLPPPSQRNDLGSPRRNGHQVDAIDTRFGPALAHRKAGIALASSMRSSEITAIGRGKRTPPSHFLADQQNPNIFPARVSLSWGLGSSRNGPQRAHLDWSLARTFMWSFHSGCPFRRGYKYAAVLACPLGLGRPKKAFGWRWPLGVAERLANWR